MTPRQQKIAAAYDTDIWPLVPARTAELILRALPERPGARVLEAACATGNLTFAVAQRLDEASRVVAYDPSPALIERAEIARAAHPAKDRISFHTGEPAAPLAAAADGDHDLAIANLPTAAELVNPKAAIANLVQCLKPGGHAIVALPLRGCWTEFLDLYADVLTEQRKDHVLKALDDYRRGLPEAETAAGWLEAAGLVDVTVEVARWELLFKSAREFFFAPVIELGPLDIWKQIAGGHGDEMQDVFFFVKEAIETYFSGTVFSVTMVAACLKGTKSKRTRLAK